MYIKSIILISLLVVFVLPGSPAAQDYGTASEAKAMLERAAKAIKKDKDSAMAAFTNGEKKYKEKDLYVFCFDSRSGEVLAHGAKKSLIGDNVRTKKDKAGKPYGEALFQAGVEGEYKEVSYMFQRPGESKLSAKSSYVTRVKGLTCGVGYYK